MPQWHDARLFGDTLKRTLIYLRRAGPAPALAPEP